MVQLCSVFLFQRNKSLRIWILSCVKRAYDKLGFSLGKGILVGILHGSKMQKMKDFRLDELTTYGIMQEQPRWYIREIVDFLEKIEEFVNK